jgi:hypothetical protein
VIKNEAKWLIPYSWPGNSFNVGLEPEDSHGTSNTISDLPFHCCFYHEVYYSKIKLSSHVANPNQGS